MSRNDEGYVHDPDAFDADGERVDDESERVDSRGNRPDPLDPTTADRTFDWRGWVLVAIVVFAFVVCPVAIVLWPPELHYFVALLILPLAPAALLGIVAVWATTRP